MQSGVFSQDAFRQQTFLVTGGAGFLGRHVCAELRRAGVTPEQISVPRSQDHDLTCQQATFQLVADTRPSVILHLAADAGGIGADRDNPGRFFYANMAMGLHLIEAARAHDVQKFVQIGSVSAYPKFTPVPFQECDFWSGYPDETHAPFGVAKKALLVMADAYRSQYGFNGISLTPTTLYGPHDNFDLKTAHVIPALIRKVVEAQENQQDTIVCWGDGSPTREFLFVEDAARGIVDAARSFNEPGPVNLGSGQETTIKALARQVANLCEFRGQIVWDAAKPNGQQRRCLDTTRAAETFGFHTAIGLEQGLRVTIDWYRQSRTEALALVE